VLEVLTQAELRSPPAPGELIRHEFDSMSMTITLIAPEPRNDRERWTFNEAASEVELVFRRAHQRFSRFESDSELSRVNAGAGRWQRVSSEFAELTRRALDAARATDGLFDPTVLPELIAAGYDRDFDEMVPMDHAAARRLPTTSRRYHHVELEGRLLFLPPGAALDFGGIAKGWAVDQAARVVRGLPWAVIDAGGDLRLAGRPVHPVPIGLVDPIDPSVEILQVGLEAGALATTSVVTRSWGPGLHHVIDPRTRRPASTGVQQATVWAETCTEADVRSKWALLVGARVLRELPAALVMEDGRVLVSLRGEVRPAC
jgi:thiamine biosynthesis lipoprotein